MKRRHFLGAGLAIASSLAINGSILRAYAQVANINDAINKAGRQRMLSQRLAKGYLQVGQAIDIERSRQIFSASLNLFEKQLAELQAFAPTPENRATLDECERAWGSYKQTLLARTPNAQDARPVMAQNEDVLALAHAATVQLEKFSGSSIGRLVNISGRQRMLSQRMAKFYQALNWGVAPGDAANKLIGARKEFVAALAELAASPKNTRQISDEIGLVQQQWIFFDNALNAAGRDRAQLALNVATTSERILQTMDGITGMYEKLT
jgi:hypothetical protein